jgi:hypothetical protein
MRFKEWLKINEGSAEDAKETLDAIVSTLSKNKDLNKEGKEILTMAKGMVKHFNKEKSFSPDQAEWIYKVSKMFK